VPSRYYQRLYADAFERDRVALATLIRMLGMTEVDKLVWDKGFWEHEPIDQAMEHARGLTDMKDWFYDRLKNMLVENRVTVLGVTPDNTVEPIRDPAVIDFDDEVFHTEEAFFNILEKIRTLDD